MLEITDIPSLRDQIRHWKAQQHRLAFVPTMGNLHQGHLELVRYAKDQGDKVIVSIFVNPMQFPPGSDFENYPRTLKEDAGQLMALGADMLFAPQTADIYPDLERTTKVLVPELSNILCGEFRPGHFAGVTTIVAKLFNLVQPDLAVFGAKDYQQVAIIKKMVCDLEFAVDIHSRPTVREEDGLAMSSRNQYLTPEERKTAPRLYQVLSSARQQIHSGADFSGVETSALRDLARAGFKPEYVSVRHAQTLAPAGGAAEPMVILAAAWLGKARLIDNIAV